MEADTDGSERLFHESTAIAFILSVKNFVVLAPCVHK